MILVHKKDPHDWQGDVISDLKRPREFWPDDWDVNAKNVKIIPHEPRPKSQGEDSSSSNNTTTSNSQYAHPGSLTPIPDGQSQLPPSHSIMAHMSDPSRAEPLSLVQPSSAMQMMTSAGPPISSTPSSLSSYGHMPSHDPMGGHSSESNSAVEMAAASILNLSAHLPPLPPPPMSHLSSVPMDGQMPSILNLSTMHNMNYSHHGSS